MITLRDLKEYLDKIPEDQLDDGELWIGDGDGLSNECKNLWPLNVRDDSQDLLVE